MANILLPLASVWLILGRTVDITEYDFDVYLRRSHNLTRNYIFNETDYVVTRPGHLKSTYYVLPDGKVPYSALGLPIDLALRIKLGTYSPSHIDLMTTVLDYRDDFPALLVVTEYVEGIKSLKETVPFPDWKDTTPKEDTHYAENFQFGIRCTGLFQIGTLTSGDAAIARKILLTTMGPSGQVKENTFGLWQKAVKSIKENIRDTMYVWTRSMSNVGTMNMVYTGVEDMLKNPEKISTKLMPIDYNKRIRPILVNFRSLHSLDKQYPELERSSKTEEYMEKLNNMLVDLDYTFNKALSVQYSNRNKSAVNHFKKDVQKKQRLLKKLEYGDMSLYKDINVTAFHEAFEIYESGLDKGTHSYYLAFKKLLEDTATRCENDFLKPTKGFLDVADNEVIKMNLVEGGLKECQKQCLGNDKCRAISYSDTKEDAGLFSGIGELCWIYYRSTNTADIYASKNSLVDVELYDRICK